MLYLPIDGVRLSSKSLDSFLHPNLPDVTIDKDEIRGQFRLETINLTLTHLRCVSSLGIVKSRFWRFFTELLNFGFGFCQKKIVLFISLYDGNCHLFIEDVGGGEISYKLLAR